jgi:UDP-N-acetylmuramoylalanine--D-glutamate ligase
LILNLTPDHLDRHGNFQAYKEIKFRITENQTADDYFIVNHDDPETMAASVETGATRMRFSVGPGGEAVTFVRQEHLAARIGGNDVKIIPCAEMCIPGEHNLQNAAASVAAVIPFSIDPDVIAGVLKTFPGVEHRLEKVGRVAGISFVNDSKATNVDSVLVALRAMKGPVHLIMGGRDKGSPYEPIIGAGKEQVRNIVAIGEARDKIFDALGRTFPVQFAQSLEEAVNQSFETARPGETVLLSPACASFDMFDDFEHRGRVFKETVAALTKGRKENGKLTSH